MNDMMNNNMNALNEGELEGVNGGMLMSIDGAVSGTCAAVSAVDATALGATPAGSCGKVLRRAGMKDIHGNATYPEDGFTVYWQ